MHLGVDDASHSVTEGIYLENQKKKKEGQAPAIMDEKDVYVNLLPIALLDLSNTCLEHVVDSLFPNC